MYCIPGLSEYAVKVIFLDEPENMAGVLLVTSRPS